jgi:hypothetical protein
MIFCSWPSAYTGSRPSTDGHDRQLNWQQTKFVAANLEVPMIEHTLEHVGLPARAPPQAPTRDSM